MKIYNKSSNVILTWQRGKKMATTQPIKNTSFVF
ncbi:hypothetical protein ZONE111904_19335 [Zobellia nedashkovskayae]